MRGELTGLSLNYITKKPEITLTVDGDIEQLEKLKGQPLTVELKRFRRRRSLEANALLWYCIGEISRATHLDKMDLYKKALRDHGQFTYVIVKEGAVEAMQKEWRACDVVGEIDVNGQKAVQMLCYFGSSTYNTKEFSDLLDGVIEDMKDLGLDAPTPGDLRRAIEQWEKNNGK